MAYRGKLYFSIFNFPVLASWHIVHPGDQSLVLHPCIVTVSFAACIQPLLIQNWHWRSTSRHDLVGYTPQIGVSINANYRDMFCEINIPEPSNVGKYWRTSLEILASLAKSKNQDYFGCMLTCFKKDFQGDDYWLNFCGFWPNFLSE